MRRWPFALLVVAALGACDSRPTCDAPARLAAGAPSDFHGGANDGGFTVEGPFDAGTQVIRVSAAGAPLERACHGADAGGYYEGYGDGGFDYFFDDGGLVDGDGGCHRTDAFVDDLQAGLEGEEVTGVFAQDLPDGGAGVTVIFSDWRAADTIVQTVGQTLVTDGVGGSVDVSALDEQERCL